MKIESKQPSTASIRPPSSAIDPELREELRGIFKAGGRGFSNGVDNFLHTEIGQTFVAGKGYQPATTSLGERARLAAGLLREMKAAFPEAFHEGPLSGLPETAGHEREGQYMQALLEQLDSVVQHSALTTTPGEPDAAKRARVVLPQLLGVDEASLPVRTPPPAPAGAQNSPSVDDVGARTQVLREHSKGGSFLGQPTASRSTPALMGANLEVPPRKA